MKRFALILRSCLLHALLVAAFGCAKKQTKPRHTEPWLAHPPASASADAAEGALGTHYVLTEQSRVEFELSGRRGAIRGSFSRVQGQLTIDPSALEQSRGLVEVALDSITLSRDSEPDAVERARSALGVSDAGAPHATFELGHWEDVSPISLEPLAMRGPGQPLLRKARGTAVGNLLLHGFRVQRRAPLEAEFSFDVDPQRPTTVAIRSRAPFVISLETHEIRAFERDPSAASPDRKRPIPPREARVSVELYAIKSQ